MISAVMDDDFQINYCKSHLMMSTLRKSKKIASTDKSVLIIGEFGSGKSWLAKYIHRLSNRRNNLFVRGNCYSIYQDEVQNKLFGQISNPDKLAGFENGLLNKCRGGTIYLEGFDALPTDTQYHIINVIQSGFYTPTGSRLQLPVDVRLIVSVRNFPRSFRKGKLLSMSSVYEINPHIILQPPLRYRREDILPLIMRFLNQNPTDLNVFNTNVITPEAAWLCINYDWPGNVAQLKNAIEQAKILATNKIIQSNHLPVSVLTDQPDPQWKSFTEYNKSYQIAESSLMKVLLKNMYSLSQIADLMDLNHKSIEEKIYKYNLKQLVN